MKEGRREGNNTNTHIRKHKIITCKQITFLCLLKRSVIVRGKKEQTLKHTVMTASPSVWSHPDLHYMSVCVCVCAGTLPADSLSVSLFGQLVLNFVSKPKNTPTTLSFPFSFFLVHLCFPTQTQPKLVVLFSWPDCYIANHHFIVKWHKWLL